MGSIFPFSSVERKGHNLRVGSVDVELQSVHLLRESRVRTPRHLRREIGFSLPKSQRQHRTVHVQKDVLPYGIALITEPHVRP